MNTKSNAIAQVATAIEANGTDVASRDEFNLDAIVDETHTFDAVDGYVQTADDAEFWAAVERNAL